MSTHVMHSKTVYITLRVVKHFESKGTVYSTHTRAKVDTQQQSQRPNKPNRSTAFKPAVLQLTQPNRSAFSIKPAVLQLTPPNRSAFSIKPAVLQLTQPNRSAFFGTRMSLTGYTVRSFQ